MTDIIANVANFINANWEKFVKLVDEIWQFLKDTILKDDSIGATKGE